MLERTVALLFLFTVLLAVSHLRQETSDVATCEPPACDVVPRDRAVAASGDRGPRSEDPRAKENAGVERASERTPTSEPPVEPEPAAGPAPEPAPAPPAEPEPSSEPVGGPPGEAAPAEEAPPA